MRQAGILTIIMAVTLGLFFTAPTPARALQGPITTGQPSSNQPGGFMVMTTPASCPPGGCAAGQTLGFRLDFSMSGQASSPQSNTRICIYAPEGWVTETSVSISETSLSLNIPLTALTNEDPDDCGTVDPAPPGSEALRYSLITERKASYPTGGIIDALEFGFRISPTATGTGTIVARVFKNTGAAWESATDVFIPSLPVIPPGNPSYVASQPGQCGGAQPCYVDSAKDLPGGLGTGLKDAADAVAPGAVVRILGTYSVKTQTVEITRPIIIEGQNNATLTYSGAECKNRDALISLKHGVTLRNLNINDGACSDPNRVLIKIDRDNSVTEDAPVLIEGNTLTGGDNAIEVHNTAGPLTIRYNQITNNAGLALFWNSNSDEDLEMVANNLHGNGIDAVVDCAAGEGGKVENRVVDHNYWGTGFTTDRAPSCNIDADKRLYAPIARESNKPGVKAALITVDATKRSVSSAGLSGELSFRRTNYDKDYQLYVVDHGDPIAQGLPYTGELLNSPHPCSNLYDVFLPSGVEPGGTLELYLKYDKNSVCSQLITSAQFCGQTADKAKYPLYWWYPAKKNWYTTRFNIPDVDQGQETECSTGDKEIRVMIDESGKPGLDDDLLYTPFMVGVPLLNSYSITPGDLLVTLNWSTTAEPDIASFVVQSSEDPGTSFTDVSTIIPARGGPQLPASYSYTDVSVDNDIKYYYRLKIVRTDGLIFYYNLGDATPQEPQGVTRTPTRTPTRTRTLTPTRTSIFNPTRTPTPTRRLTIIPTRNFTATPDRTQTLTNTPYMLATRTLATDADLTVSPTPSPVTVTPSTPTPTRRVTRTPAVTLAQTPVSPAASGGLPAWASLLLGLLAGTLSVGAAAFWWFYRPRS